jgi:hypothetical protein
LFELFLLPFVFDGENPKVFFVAFEVASLEADGVIGHAPVTYGATKAKA